MSTRFDLTGGVTASDGPVVDLIVIDDTPSMVRGLLEAHLSHSLNWRPLMFQSVVEFAAWLRGAVLPTLPPPPYDPVLALVDLQLDPADPHATALPALRMLRGSSDPALAQLPAVLNANPLLEGRDLLAVFAAILNGGGILASYKTESDGRRLDALLSALLAAPEAAARVTAGSAAGLDFIRAVVVRTAFRGTTRDTPLLQWLLDAPWKRKYWEQMARHRDHRTAVAVGYGFEDRRDDAQDLARRVMRSFGELPVAWHLSGGSFATIGGVIDLDKAKKHPEYTAASNQRGKIVIEFAARYASILADKESWSLVEKSPP